MNIIELKEQISELRMEKQSFLNDTYLWVSVARDAIRELPGEKLIFKTPKAGKASESKIIFRDNREKVINRIIKKDIFNSAFVTVITSIEDYLNKIMKLILEFDSRRLKYTIQGVNMITNIPVVEFIDNSRDDMINNIINQRLESLFYASPKKQLEYLEKVLGIKLEEELWGKWIESKARREEPKYKNHKKVTQIIVTDLRDLSGVDMKIVGKVDVAFDLVATTVKDAFKGEEEYRKVDVEMTSEFAKFAKKAGATFLSSIGMADMKGYDYASRAKKDFKNFARSLNFQRVTFMHPKWVNRETHTNWHENFYTLFGLLGTKASHMARCIVWAAKNQTEAEKIYSIKEIKQIGINAVK